MCSLGLLSLRDTDVYGWGGRFRRFDIKEILDRDKTSLDLFWIKDKSLADLDSLPEPDVLASDIIENLQSALESFQELQAQLNKR